MRIKNGPEAQSVQQARTNDGEEIERLGRQLAEHALALRLGAPSDEVYAEIVRIFLTLAHRLAIEMTDHRARGQQTSLLAMLVLDLVHRATRPCGSREVARFLGSSPSSVTELLRRMERDELVIMNVDGCDRRRRTICLTDRGREEATRAASFFASWRPDFELASFGEDDVRRFYHSLLAFQELVIQRHQDHFLLPRTPRAGRPAAVHVR